MREYSNDKWIFQRIINFLHNVVVVVAVVWMMVMTGSLNSVHSKKKKKTKQTCQILQTQWNLILFAIKF